MNEARAAVIHAEQLEAHLANPQRIPQPPWSNQFAAQYEQLEAHLENPERIPHPPWSREFEEQYQRRRSARLATGALAFLQQIDSDAAAAAAAREVEASQTADPTEHATGEGSSSTTQATSM